MCSQIVSFLCFFTFCIFAENYKSRGFTKKGKTWTSFNSTAHIYMCVYICVYIYIFACHRYIYVAFRPICCLHFGPVSKEKQLFFCPLGGNEEDLRGTKMQTLHQSLVHSLDIIFTLRLIHSGLGGRMPEKA